MVLRYVALFVGFQEIVAHALADAHYRGLQEGEAGARLGHVLRPRGD